MNALARAHGLHMYSLDMPCLPPSSGIPELVAALRAHGKEVFLVSGGFRQIIHPLAQKLGIPLEHVFANSILFDVSGCQQPGSLAMNVSP